MAIARIDLADRGSPDGLVQLILRGEPSLTYPVPIEELCYQLDIQDIQSLKTEGFVGGLLTDTSRSTGIILVKQGLSRQRRRFTVGHELGHFLIATHVPDKEGQFLCSASDMALLHVKEQARRARMEVEANRFSSLILMPPPLLRPLIGSKEPSIEHVFELADSFDVSREAMSRTYTEYHPAAVAFVLVHNGVVQRTYRNQRRFPFIVVRKGQMVPTGSTFHRKVLKEGTPGNVDSVLPETWIDVEWGKRAPGLYEQICFRAKGHALIMLWYEAADEEADSDDYENMTSKERLKYRQSRRFS